MRATKPCNKCLVVKSLGNFYAHLQMADGHLNTCKDCCKQANRANRAEKVAQCREYERKRSRAPHRVKAREEYLKGNGREVATQAKRRWIHRNPKARAAQILFNNRKRYDPRLANKPCETCGALDTHAHHPDYNQPLEVRWFCPLHHKEIQILEGAIL